MRWKWFEGQVFRLETWVSLAGMLGLGGLMTYLWSRLEPIVAFGWPAWILLGIVSACGMLLVASFFMVAFRYFNPVDSVKTQKEKDRDETALRKKLFWIKSLEDESAEMLARITFNNPHKEIKIFGRMGVLRGNIHGWMWVWTGSHVLFEQNNTPKQFEAMFQVGRINKGEKVFYFGDNKIHKFELGSYRREPQNIVLRYTILCDDIEHEGNYFSIISVDAKEGFAGDFTLSDETWLKTFDRWEPS